MEERPKRKRRHQPGEGTVYFDKAVGGWVAVLRLGDDPETGKRRTVKSRAPKGAKRGDADRLLTRLQRRYGRGGDVAMMTLDDYLAEWLDAVVKPNRAPSTLAVYRIRIDKHISPLLGGIRVGALHQRDVRRLIADRLAAGKSAQTVVSIVDVLKSALAQAVKDGDLVTNVAIVEMPRIDREPVEAMTPETAKAILAAIDEHHHKALWVLLLGTGMRIGEACALDWRDLRLPRPGRPVSGDETVTIRHPKERRARQTPLPAFVVTALVEHRARAKRIGPYEPVFLGEITGRRLGVVSASHAFPRAMVRAGLPRITAHKLRHGLATLLLQQGIPMRDIADILGHADPSLTARVYAHVSEGSKRAAMDRLAEVVEG